MTKLKVALSGQSPADVRTLLQAVAKMAVSDLLRNIMYTKHQNKGQNIFSHAIGFKSTYFYLQLIYEF